MPAQESLSQQRPASGLKRLLLRSSVAVCAISALIVVVALLPAPSGSAKKVLPDSTRNVHECGRHDHLRQILVLHRHGERSSVRWYDFEQEWPWADKDIGIGKLTVHGMRQGFDLGQSLRDEYAHHMKLDSADSVTVFSTDVDRTVDTAHSVLLGLFSPRGTPVSEEDACECREDHGVRSTPDCLASCLELQTIPDLPEVQVRKRNVTKPDASFYQTGKGGCKGYDAWRRKLETSKEWMEAPKKKFAHASNLVSELVDSDKVQTLTWPAGTCDGCMDVGEDDFNTLAFMETIWSNLVCYETIPKPYSPSSGSNKKLKNALDPVSDYVWKKRYASEAGKLTGGALLYEWLDVLSNTAAAWSACAGSKDHEECQGDSVAQMRIYSAHDTTVYSLLSALGAAEEVHLPGFTAHVVAELWETQTGCDQTPEFSVHLKYDDTWLTASPACENGRCSLTDLIKGTRDSVLPPEQCKRPAKGVDHIFTEHDKECCSD